VNCHEVGRLLDAYVDNELERDESVEFGRHLETCATCLHRLGERESLARLVRGAPYYTAPDRLRAVVVNATMRAPSRFAPRLLAWAAVVTMAAALGSSWLVRTVRSKRAVEATTSVAEDVVSSHVQALMGDRLVDVRSSDQHTVKPWFLGKLEFSPPVEDFTRIGFPLVGGRLDYIAGRAVAALIYQRRQHPIDLFVWPASDGATPADTRSIRGFQVRHWIHNGMSFWAVSDLNHLELDELVTTLQR
jgi:anti-sigma factor RsiW